jgi:hypothetical protein
MGDDLLSSVFGMVGILLLFSDLHMKKKDTSGWKIQNEN